jgi:hypothetical protein
MAQLPFLSKQPAPPLPNQLYWWNGIGGAWQYLPNTTGANWSVVV